jgi:hypothetical protein
MLILNQIESFEPLDLKLKMQKEILKNEKKISKLKEKILYQEVKVQISKQEFL